MAFKIREQKEFEKTPNGIATIVRLKGNALGVTFSESNDNSYAGTRYRVLTWPEYVNPAVLGGGKLWRVKLDSDETNIFSISPLSGVYLAHVKEFTKKEGSPPIPKEHKYTFEGELYTYQYFTVLIEILDDPTCAGMILSYRLRYYFYGDEEGNTGIDKPRSKYTPQLIEFLSLTGVMKGSSIPFTDNILPVLEARILKADAKFKILVKNGYIDSLMQLDFIEVPNNDVEEDWGDEDVSNTPIASNETITPTPTFDIDWDEAEQT